MIECGDNLPILYALEAVNVDLYMIPEVRRPAPPSREPTSGYAIKGCVSIYRVRRTKAFRASKLARNPQ